MHTKSPWIFKQILQERHTSDCANAEVNFAKMSRQIDAAKSANFSLRRSNAISHRWSIGSTDAGFVSLGAAGPASSRTSINRRSRYEDLAHEHKRALQYDVSETQRHRSVEMQRGQAAEVQNEQRGALIEETVTDSGPSRRRGATSRFGHLDFADDQSASMQRASQFFSRPSAEECREVLSSNRPYLGTHETLHIVNPDLNGQLALLETKRGQPQLYCAPQKPSSAHCGIRAETGNDYLLGPFPDEYTVPPSYGEATTSPRNCEADGLRTSWHLSSPLTTPWRGLSERVGSVFSSERSNHSGEAEVSKGLSREDRPVFDPQRPTRFDAPRLQALHIGRYEQTKRFNASDTIDCILPRTDVEVQAAVNTSKDPVWLSGRQQKHRMGNERPLRRILVKNAVWVLISLLSIACASYILIASTKKIHANQHSLSGERGQNDERDSGGLQATYAVLNGSAANPSLKSNLQRATPFYAGSKRTQIQGPKPVIGTTFGDVSATDDAEVQQARQAQVHPGIADEAEIASASARLPNFSGSNTAVDVLETTGESPLSTSDGLYAAAPSVASSQLRKQVKEERFVSDDQAMTGVASNVV